jgi:glutaredoxin 3
MPGGEEVTKSVTIYTKPGCPFCMAAKADLKFKGVEYIEYNVKADAQRLEEMLQLNGGQRKVPTIVEGEKVTVGFAGY